MSNDIQLMGLWIPDIKNLDIIVSCVWSKSHVTRCTVWIPVPYLSHGFNTGHFPNEHTFTVWTLDLSSIRIPTVPLAYQNKTELHSTRKFEFVLTLFTILKRGFCLDLLKIEYSNAMLSDYLSPKWHTTLACPRSFVVKVEKSPHFSK